MNVGSLFSGIGGFDEGLERAGMRVLWQSEINAYCRKVLSLRWPDVRLHGDIRDLGADTAEPVDVISGGFPCQDISLAGKGAGIAGARSGLWAEMFRVVGELRPRFVVVENVPALTSRGLGRVIGDLASIGYDAEWDCLPASAFGAPHRRDRLWLVAYSDGGRRQVGQKLDSEPAQGTANRRASGRHVDGLRDEVADTESGRRPTRWTWRPDPGREGQREQALSLADPDSQPPLGPAIAWQERGPWATEPDVGRVAHGVSARVDRLSALGNSLVPQIAEWLGRRILDYEGL